MKSVALLTLGCKVNQYETQAVREALQGSGMREVGWGAPADVVVINTCAVTAQADGRSRKAVRQARRRNPEAVIVVTGCYADSDSLGGWAGEADAVVPNASKGRLAEVVRSAIAAREAGTPFRGRLAGRVAWEGSRFAGRKRMADPALTAEEATSTELMTIRSFEGHTRAVLKIQNGCDLFCSFCIIPYTRGLPRSKPLARIESEARDLAASGHREIVLTGVHAGAWGQDLPGRPRVADAVLAALRAPVDRVRLSSIEVQELTAREFALLDEPRFCRHFHVPLQSGDDGVLRRMNRRYSAADFLRAAGEIRRRVPDAAITTDVIAGFPGETEEAFANTLRVCEEAGISKIHVFPYSDRAGTPAAGYDGKVGPRELAQRCDRLDALGSRLGGAYRSRFEGKTVDVLFEGLDEPSGLAGGFTDRYVSVLAASDTPLRGRLLPIRVTGIAPEALLGSLS
ncbi:MAG: tRNA (N(6)-L-threonylcarbamoyladenosine(37)-C(2))-methylthiotransferase MtaB [Planctomycetes bacterium]|nr:tRNA (N(6)-L-threonylcarbamoyladenosine(37)-C(2))-methylthiotransferase MtaB [Planctomycetota bacterium]